MKPPVIKTVLSIALGLWVILITFLSLTSTETISSGLFNIAHLDKVVHFLFYFVFALLLFRILVECSVSSLTIIVLIATIIPIVYSGVMELSQEYLTATRQAEFLDFLMNILGAVMAVFIGKKLVKYEYQKQYVKEFS
jgi:VanZ family protein